MRLANAVRIVDIAMVKTRARMCDVESRLADDCSSAALARELTRETLARVGYEGHHYDVVLAVSELVANALVHGAGAPVLRLTGTPTRIRVEVRDSSPVLPALRPPRWGDGGWGLKLVQQVAADWGARAEDGGKVVWCDIASGHSLEETPQRPT